MVKSVVQVAAEVSLGVGLCIVVSKWWYGNNGVAAVGIDVPRIFNLYMLEPGKSFIRVIQSIGRSIRMADDKDFANVFDLTSTHKYSKRHLTTRKKYYKKQEYPFTVKKVDYI